MEWIVVFILTSLLFDIFYQILKRRRIKRTLTLSPVSLRWVTNVA